MKKTKKSKRGRPVGSKNKVKQSKAEKSKHGSEKKNLVPPTTKKKKSMEESTTTVAVDVSNEDINSIISNPITNMIVDSQENSGIFKRIKKPKLVNGWTHRTTEFIDVPREFHVDQDLTAKGTRVLIATCLDSNRIYLKKYHAPGEPGWKFGGVEVYNASNHRTEYYSLEQVAVHPKGGSIRMIEIEAADGVESSVVIDEYVAGTAKEQREHRKIEKREKKIAKEEKKRLKLEIRTTKEKIKEKNAQRKQVTKRKDKKLLSVEITELKSKVLALKKDLEIHLETLKKNEAKSV